MDITPLFKACVKTVRLKNKSLPMLDKNRILKKNIPKNDFSIKSKNIKYQITQLRNFLIENRAAYMKFACHLKGSAQMSDEERDIIDEESDKIINICTQLIVEFKNECKKIKTNKQGGEHMDGVLELLSEYLKCVYNIHNQQKTYRIQRELETYKLIKLESDKRKIPIVPSFKDPKNFDSDSESNDENDDLGDNGDDNTDDMFDEDNDAATKTKLNETLTKKKLNTGKLSLDEEIAHNQTSYEEEELSAEDIQMFESENLQLYNELRGLSEEVEQIEKNVVGIAKLQEIFTEKVTLQKTDIERIANTVVGATENVKDANEQIKQAIQRNAGLRVYVLFFLLVMSFSLLFLDWYND